MPNTTQPSRLTNYIESEIQLFSKIPLDQKLTEEQSKRLSQLKQALAVAHGLEGENPRSVSKQLKSIRSSLEQVTFEPEPYFAKSEGGKTTFTATELYLNEKVQDLYNRAEVERQDYRRVDNPPNVFFGQQRRFRYAPDPEEMAPDEKSRVIIVETLRLNLVAMFAFVVGAFFLLHTSLKRQLRKV